MEQIVKENAKSELKKSVQEIKVSVAKPRMYLIPRPEEANTRTTESSETISSKNVPDQFSQPTPQQEFSLKRCSYSSTSLRNWEKNGKEI